MYKHQKHTLENGLRVITIPMMDTAAVSVLIMANVGSRYESREINGISHFLEHMVFKGTKNKPSTIEISSTIDALGAEFNAFTSEEYTGYYIKSQAKDFNTSLETLHDMLYNSLFDQKEIDREKGVISAEINMYRDDPKLHVYQLAQSLIYGDTPLGWDVAGKIETIKTFKRENFLDYLKKFYKAKNIVIAVAGKQIGSWIDEIEKITANKEAGEINNYKKVAISQKQPAVNLEYRKTDQAHFILSFRTFSRYDKRRHAAEVLSNILGGSMSSRLFISVRERKGLAYYVRSSSSLYGDNGDFGINAGVDPNRVDEAISTVREEIEKIQKELVGEKELNKSKENICGRFALSLEESLEVAQYFAAEELLLNNIEDPMEYSRHIRAVTAEDVRDLAKEIFDFNKSNLAIVGPYKDEEKFLKLIRQG